MNFCSHLIGLLIQNVWRGRKIEELVYIILFFFSVCDSYKYVSHGRVDFTDANLTVGSVLPIICDSGYELHGEYGIKCMLGGTWKVNATCKRNGTENTHMLNRMKNVFLSFINFATSLYQMQKISAAEKLQNLFEWFIALRVRQRQKPVLV